METTRKFAEDLVEGDVLIGVLSGRPWRTVRSVETYRDGGIDWVNVDAVPVDGVGDFYSPVAVEVGVSVEVAK